MAKLIGKKSQSASRAQSVANSNGRRAAANYGEEESEVASEIRNFFSRLAGKYGLDALEQLETPVKRPVGRPKGSGKKQVEADAEPVPAKRPVGRPKGAGKKVVEEPDAPKRPVGRPKGSGKKRVEIQLEEESVVAKRPVGRPKGSTKKAGEEKKALEEAREAQANVAPPTYAAKSTPRSSAKPERLDAPREASVEIEPPTERRPIGRPKGSSKYGEPIRTVRIPESIATRIDGFIDRKGDVVQLYDAMVQAGFPSPAEDASYETLDLGAFLMPNPPATFFVRAIGESMRDAGIFPGDVLIVDRSLEPSNGDVVVAALNGEFTVKRLFKTASRTELRPENRRFAPIAITEDLELTIWGVVKKVIHNV